MWFVNFVYIYNYSPLFGYPLNNEVLSDLDITFSTKYSNNKTIVLLTEAGIYSLIMRSRISSAKEFQKWVFEDVLPQIRTTGVYVPIERKTKVYISACFYLFHVGAINTYNPYTARVYVDNVDNVDF